MIEAQRGFIYYLERIRKNKNKWEKLQIDVELRKARRNLKVMIKKKELYETT